MISKNYGEGGGGGSSQQSSDAEELFPFYNKPGMYVCLCMYVCMYVCLCVISQGIIYYVDVFVCLCVCMSVLWMFECPCV